MSVNYSPWRDIESMTCLGFASERDTYDMSPWLNKHVNIKSLVASFMASGQTNSPDSIVRIVFNDEVEIRDDNAARFVLYLRVTELRKVYPKYEEDGSTRYGPWPSWYFEALIDQPAFDPSPTAPAVRCFIGGDREDWEFGLMQFITGLPVGYNRLPGT